MRNIETIFRAILIFTLVLVSSAAVLAFDAPAFAKNDNPHRVKTFFDDNGNQVDMVAFPGKPPEFKYTKKTVPEPVDQMANNNLSDVPAFDWSYGCSATSAAMLFGYYDRQNYPDMYTGPTNDSVCPLNNAVWGHTAYPSVTCGECPLSATHQTIDGLTSNGHVDDYWVDYGQSGNDPYIGNPPEHSYEDCTGDFMGTNQDRWNNVDGSTYFFFGSGGDPLYDYTGYEWLGYRDGCHGMRLFAESRGYTVVTNFNQYIEGYASPTKGFTFADFVAEIDAGRPVLIQVVGHTMIGYGYDTTGNIVYLHNTWDWGYDTMTWGGTYSGMQHVGVTVFRLASITTPPTVATNEATDITTTSARLNGYLDDMGTATTVDVSFVWGDTPGGPYPNETTPPDTMSASGAIYFNLPGLSPDTTYYFKAKAVGDGTRYGVERSFTTQAAPDTAPPYTSSHDPAKGATDVPTNTNIVLHVLDDGDGVDDATIAMTVEGAPVTPVITGSPADYTLTYDPLTDFDYLQVVDITVDASDLAGNPMDTDSYSFTTNKSQLEYFYANQDIPVQNSGITGSYLDTYSPDDSHEGIKERESGGKPSKRHSYLEHKWIIPVIGGLQSYEFKIEAYHTDNSEGDDFIFAYSTNDVTYTDMDLFVTKTTDDNSYQTYTLPQSISGPIYIRVMDTDQTSGNRNLDTIYIDHMYILGSGTPPPNKPPDKPSNPDPSEGATGVDINPTLSVYAYDPDGDTMDISFYYDEFDVLIGTDDSVSSGSTASIPWLGLSYETTYGWYAVAEDDEEYTSQSETWHFSTRSETEPGGMYVWDISWAPVRKNLESYVTIRRDSDGDGIAGISDELVSGATVYYTLTHEGESKNYVETTDANGQISIQWKKATAGSYVGLVTDITHSTYSTYTYAPEMDFDNPDDYPF